MSRPAIQDARSSLARGLSLLDLFSARDEILSISEMSRRSGIPKSTAHRLVADLVQWGALDQDQKGFRIGRRLFELGHLVPGYRALRDVAVPYTHTLNEVTGLTSNLAIRDGRDVMYLEKIASRKLRVPHSRGGGRLPMHCTALGKAILAYSKRDFVESILSEPMGSLTKETITDPTLLRRELAAVRKQKVAYDVEESELGLFCVAAPIFARRNALVGAISVTGATALSQAQQFAPTVRSTAMALSRVMGFTGTTAP